MDKETLVPPSPPRTKLAAIHFIRLIFPDSLLLWIRISDICARCPHAPHHFGGFPGGMSPLSWRSIPSSKPWSHCSKTDCDGGNIKRVRCENKTFVSASERYLPSFSPHSSSSQIRLPDTAAATIPSNQKYPRLLLSPSSS